ncbi:MAG TPA: hypothetical protein VGQ57_09240 [Polyangiaceae bacterium]|jgi:hypothetical protein|nr:hypothetical protein [Polyangiaceae bacterium]
MGAHVIKWLKPAPLWRDAGVEVAALTTPSILRFASDSFMEEFLALAERDPDAIANLSVAHETWKRPMGSPKQLEAPITVEREPRRVRDLARFRWKQLRAASTAKPAATTTASARYELKLYQPVHQRYYLVTASLVCATPGFPDRHLDPGKQERASFVLRRLVPRGAKLTDDLPDMDPDKLGDWDEYAFVQTRTGPTWRQTDAAGQAVTLGEERLPLFPVTFRDAGDHARRMFSGMVPVGRREAYLGASLELKSTSADDDAKAAQASDPRRLLFVTQVIAPWKSLVATGRLTYLRSTNDTSPLFDDSKFVNEKEAIRKQGRRTAREQIQIGSWYLLLDLYDLLHEHLPNVLAALLSGHESDLSVERHAEELAVWNALKSVVAPAFPPLLTGEPVDALPYLASDVATSLPEALVRLASDLTENRRRLEQAKSLYDREDADAKTTWPPFLFAVADPAFDPPPLPGAPDSSISDPIEALFPPLDALAALIGAALPPPPADIPPPATAANARGNIDPRDGWFVLRCLYEQPECGALHPPVMSAPTRPFQLAGFFDPDAPARPIRIGLPIDPTPAGLRKFDKKTFFMISDVLCGHLDRVKQLSFADLVLSVLPWPFHKDLSVKDGGPCKSGDSPLGLMCTLSLPIITLCALILLIIIVTLLDFIFHWLPWFIVCFPLPGFSAKPKRVSA